ncbi:type IV conjugative transfer system protein TraL [Burkholderia sp. MBR-1]|uniref:type IV conjugative transfer system protein TraL n=1 Tax=Burkholderia sp. MBR-1 TaxID=2732364 RepID=UPI0015EF54DC|nr:type IV conjugative transfer system protein TraL [Burkholderia sp. MBR-1]QMI49770.1 type IV conjugative transfer system protein TraL [Burkholderia sp. MBR-1]
MKRVEIPQWIDSFPQIMWFEVDEITPFIFCFAAGSLLHMTSPMLILGVGITWLYLKHKRNSLDGSLLHMMFWWGLMALNSVFKNGLIREYIE